MREETILQRRIKRLLENLGYKVAASANGAVLAGTRKQKAIQMNSLKASGLMVGYPDLTVFGPNRIGFIEVKTDGGDLSEAQETVREWMGDWGHKYAVCRSLEDVPDTLENWGWA